MKTYLFFVFIILLLIPLAPALTKKRPICATVEKCMPFAEQGNVSAQTTIGHYYSNGISVGKDYAQAIEWWSKAAEQGYAAAQYNLGHLFYKGEGVKPDYAQAREWLLKASEQNYSRATFYFGLVHFKDSEILNYIKGAHYVFKGLVSILFVPWGMLVITAAVFASWIAHKKYSGTKSNNEADNRTSVFIVNFPARAVQVTGIALSASLFAYLAWDFSLKYFYPYKCQFLHLADTPICKDTPFSLSHILTLANMPAVLLCLAGLFYRQAFIVLRSKGVAVDDDGIWHSHDKKQNSYIPWKDVHGLKKPSWPNAHSSYDFQLLDKEGKSIFCVTGAIQTNKLKEYIYNKRPELVEKSLDVRGIYSKSLHRNVLELLLIAGLVLTFFILVSAETTEKLDASILFALLTFTAFQFLVMPMKVELSDNEIVLYYPFRAKRIRYSQIKHVNLVSEISISLSLQNEKNDTLIYCTVLKTKPEVLRQEIMRRMERDTSPDSVEP